VVLLRKLLLRQKNTKPLLKNSKSDEKNLRLLCDVPSIPFYFIRHGETDWNKKQLCQGKNDIPLNDNGIQSAYEAAKNFENISLDLIITSPLLRAKQTAEIISNKVQVDFKVVSEFAERDFGELQGGSNLPMYEFEEQEIMGNISNKFMAMNIERLEDVQARITKGLKDILNPNSRVLIVSHGRLFLILCQMLSINSMKQISNTQSFLIKPENDHWELALT